MNNSMEFVKTLYQIVDSRDAASLSKLLHPDVRFRFSNAEELKGKGPVVAVNQQFFDSIAKMAHTFDGIWQQGEVIICNGEVNYVRKDNSTCSAKFATFLSLKEGLIVDYKIYADVSQLFVTSS
ncbi:nuclear transport factor 2 family protein [Vibrio amylolyticus]|uniref:nuclear transport factor 2 family protein n=1 Tax=Vibrio amylolyticus TaxID=2847292 RepID=UPI00354B6320